VLTNSSDIIIAQEKYKGTPRLHPYGQHCNHTFWMERYVAKPTYSQVELELDFTITSSQRARLCKISSLLQGQDEGLMGAATWAGLARGLCCTRLCTVAVSISP